MCVYIFLFKKIFFLLIYYRYISVIKKFINKYNIYFLILYKIINFYLLILFTLITHYIIINNNKKIRLQTLMQDVISDSVKYD